MRPGNQRVRRLFEANDAMRAKEMLLMEQILTLEALNAPAVHKPNKQVLMSRAAQLVEARDALERLSRARRLYEERLLHWVDEMPNYRHRIILHYLYFYGGRLKEFPEWFGEATGKEITSSIAYRLHRDALIYAEAHWPLEKLEEMITDVQGEV